MDAEKGVLSSILLAPDRCMRLCERAIGKNFFHHPAHSDIYEAMTEMHQDCIPIDLISLTQYLEDTGRLDKVGGAAAVTDLYTFIPTASNIPYYIEIVQEKHALRLIHRVGQEMSYKALHGGLSGRRILSREQRTNSRHFRASKGTADCRISMICRC